MLTSVNIILIGLFIFLGHYLSGVFERKSIPDVLGLIFVGMLLGPILKIVDPNSFGKFGSLFSNLVLLFILFESGTDLKISEIKSSFRDSATITTLGFLTTFIGGAALCYFILKLPILACLFIGSTLGGTSSAVVVGLVKKINVTPKTSTTLIMESAESDAFTLAVPISILTLMTTGKIETSMVISQFVASILISVAIGIVGAFLWAYILNKTPNLKATKFSTPAFLFILYGITEYINFSGPLTALSFGITIGNLQYLEPKLLKPYIPNQNIVLPIAERDFFSEMVFLLRTFFFVFIGINIRITRLDWLFWGAIITLILFLLRIIVVKIVATKDTPVLDKAVMSFMIPKGLGAAVIATLPLQNGVENGLVIQSVCFSVILFSTVYTIILFFLAKQGYTMPIYKLLFYQFKQDKPPIKHPL